MTRRNGLKSYAVVSGTGNTCLKCNVGMERRKRIALPKKSLCYYSEWDYCLSCGHVQHYEKFKQHIPHGN